MALISKFFSLSLLPHHLRFSPSSAVCVCCCYLPVAPPPARQPPIARAAPFFLNIQTNTQFSKNIQTESQFSKIIKIEHTIFKNQIQIKYPFFKKYSN